MKSSKTWLKYILVLTVLGLFLYFFSSKFLENLEELKDHQFQLQWLWLLGALFSAAMGYLLITWIWGITLNSIGHGPHLGFMDSIAIINSSLLSKYLPGKLWGYAMQVIILKKRGFDGAMVAYVGLVNVIYGLLGSFWLGFLYLASTGKLFPFWISTTLFIGLSLGLLGMIWLNERAVKLATQLLNRFIKKEIKYYHIPVPNLILGQLVFAVRWFFIGLSGLLLMRGIGFTLDFELIFLLMAAMALGDSLGFIVLILPGGLGVRESSMYYLLAATMTESIALLLPIVTRLLFMAVELGIGLCAFALLKKRFGAVQPEDAQISEGT